MNLLCLWHLLFRNDDFLGMQLLPDTKDCARFLVTVDKSTLNLRFSRQVICSAQVFSCLLIVQMQLNQPEQLWFAQRCPFPQVQEYHWFLTRIRNCRTTLRGSFITGESCEILSNPEKARNDPAKPTSSVTGVRAFPLNI